ncbi:sensor histidine kinase [Streptomyces luteireticuli]|uniref:sensor histidine kinase n=1 Tax=Streptomyces luteireticuli TaxID=173858 RepID=UPI003556DF50
MNRLRPRLSPLTAAFCGARRRDAERARAAAAVREAERLRLAGELHDFVAHQVAAMTLLAKAAGTVTPDERAAAPLRDIQRAGDEALATARRLLRVLGQDRPHRTPLHGLDRVRELAEDFRRAHPDTRVELWVDPDLGAEPVPGLAASVHRIVAEALANSARHCPGARAVAVSLRRSAGQVSVSVRDECAEAPAVPRRAPGGESGLGLVGIAERADAIGGSLTAGPVPGGWEVLAVLPVH